MFPSQIGKLDFLVSNIHYEDIIEIMDYNIPLHYVLLYRYTNYLHSGDRSRMKPIEEAIKCSCAQSVAVLSSTLRNIITHLMQQVRFLK